MLRTKELGLKPAHKVSVIVHARQGGPELDRCLCSLCCQDYFHYEIIVVDNAPRNERTRQLVACFEGIRYVPELHKGISSARHPGKSIASGDILAYIEDDCVADSQWISSIVSNYKNLPTADSVSGPSAASPNFVYRFPKRTDASAWLKRHPLLHLFNMFRIQG
jgi:glycosyltransferase involved in cell wall biosynthesis